MNPATFLRVLGPEKWSVCYVEPSVRPDDSRYGENPNRLQQHTQFQVPLIDISLSSYLAMFLCAEDKLKPPVDATVTNINPCACFLKVRVFSQMRVAPKV